MIPPTDIAHVEAVRCAVGTTVDLMVDANCAYDLATALELPSHLGRFDLTWLEEPLRSNDADELAALRRRSPIPIAAGEGEFTVERIRHLLGKEALDVVEPNVSRAGGITGLLAIADACDEHGARFSPHGVGAAIPLASALHVCAAARTFEIFEANQLPNPLRHELIATPMQITDGSYDVPDGAGLGVELKAEKIEEYRIALAF